MFDENNRRYVTDFLYFEQIGSHMAPQLLSLRIQERRGVYKGQVAKEVGVKQITLCSGPSTAHCVTLVGPRPLSVT